MTKYRIRLDKGRVIGPFNKAQMFELKSKGHIKGNEEAQVYPTGQWAPLSDLDIYDELMDDNKTTLTPKQEEATFLIDLEKLRNQKNEKSIERLDIEHHQPVDNLTETMKLDAPGFNVIPQNKNHQEETNPELLALELDNDYMPDEDLSESLSEDVGNHTVINPVAQEELAAFRRRQEEAKKQEEFEAQQALRDEENRKLQKEAAAAQALVPADESTQMFSLGSVKHELLEVAAKQEKKLVKKEKKRKAALAAEEDEETEATEAPKKNRKKLVIGLAIVAILYAVLFPEEDKPKAPPFQHLPPQIVFPIPFDKADEQASKIEYTAGQELFKVGTYPGLVKAGLKFKSSYENNLDNRDALNMLVRAYSEELRYSKNKLKDAQTIFNIIQSKRPFLIQDPNGTIGLNLFYMAIEKHAAAVDVMAKYLKLFPNNVTQDLFANYLLSLIALGKIDQAKQFYVALEKAPQKNRYTYEAMIKYLMLNEESDKALELVGDAIKLTPQHVPFYLTKAEILFNKKKFDEVPPLLTEATKRNLDYNDLNRAKFLEVSGLYWAFKGDVKKASTLISKSLAINDSNELRMKLADLATPNSSAEVGKLIAESKAVKLLYQAKDFYQKHNYELAMSSAIHASDAFPGHIPSDLFLSMIQMKLGHVNQSLKTLEDLIKKYPENKDVNIALIETYIEAYKFNDAKNRIAIISSTEIRSSYEYASVNAHLYGKMGDPIRAVGWLQASIAANPLNDKDIYQLALVMIKRANFDQARSLLNKAMELDPLNPDYRIAYARMIYETQDDQAAIGYLLGLVDEFGENPKFLAEIAIFYYRAGKVKDFTAYKEKLEKLPFKDKALYEFMIRAALLDERYKEIPGLVEKLLEVEPGETESMMTAGRVLYEENKLVDAAKWFKRVQERLSSYPKVQYYVARIKLLSNDIDGAAGEIQKDIKDNGESDISLVLLGEIQVKKGEFVAAETLFKKAQKINPNSYDALMGLAELSTKRSNLDLALDLYKRAQKVKIDEPIVNKKIGDVYRLLGQGGLAIEAYKMYLEMEPEAADKPQIESYIQLMQ
jgi:tetratricopeptide (TPR) repeat protein